jgi:hypothetical protein
MPNPTRKERTFMLRGLARSFESWSWNIYLCEDATKFREVASSEHSTRSVLNLTHPDGVRYTDFENGVGTCMSLRAGGTKTDTSKRPTMAPVNIQKIENMLLTLRKL